MDAHIRSNASFWHNRRRLRLWGWLLATLLLIGFLFVLEGWRGDHLQAQTPDDATVTLFSPLSTPITTTPTIQPAQISITATIWAKVTATAQAVQLLTTTAQPPTAIPTVTPTPGPDQILDRQIGEMIAHMSVADRVGQLFVIEFAGSTVETDSTIADLIRDYRIGGVVLSQRNNNINNNDPNAPRQIATLTNQLQALAYDLILPADQALTPPEVLLKRPEALNFNLLQQVSPKLPLLIGVEQDGDGLPSSALRAGFTTLPPQMALGATWDPELVVKVGEIVGRELRAVGVNLLLGPTLDVLEQPRPESVGGLGIYTFGGDAYWVGRLGQAYIEGVHSGGEGRVATIASHFPGQGGSDRRPDEEVATIQKSLQELRRIELLPFASVTENASSITRFNGNPASTDGLMSGHIRYSSFQGSRERTPPISLAKELSTILDLEEFAPWREQGGLVMSDALGVSSIRRYYDPTLTEFPRRLVALDAFMAGNDLLYLANFSLNGDWADAHNNVRETVLFFRERYTSDPDFATRVDQSLRRILRLKLRLYSDQDEAPTLASIATSKIGLSEVLVESRDLRALMGIPHEEAQTIVGQVAREALTVLYPDPRGLTDPLPAAPQPDETILIVSDSRMTSECERCLPVPVLAPTALQEVMLRLYGPEATGQLQPSQVNSYTFEQLNALLNESAPAQSAAELESAITEADWLIFAMLDVDVARYGSSDALKQFLRLRSDRLRGKRILVLALNAPYFLDSTEISKLTAYLGIYSKTQPYLEAAVRAIFRAIPALGAPPVSVPGTRYSNLIERLEPEPEQSIGLSLLNQDVIVRNADIRTPAAAVQADLTIGDRIEIETSTIFDRNRNPVPDGTLVNFRLIYEGQELALPTDPVPTVNGKARISVPLDRGGTLRISASSVDATVSTIVLVSIQAENQAAQIEFVMPTSTPEPLQITNVSPTAVEPVTDATQPMTDTAVSGPLRSLPTRPEARVDLLTLALALVTQLVMLGLLLVVLVRVMPRAMLVYRLLWALLVGWSAYILYGLGLIPGSNWLQVTLYPWGIIPVVFIGMLLPLVWLQLRTG